MADVEPQALKNTPLDTHRRLRERLTEAVIARAEIRHAPLNAFLRIRLGGTDIARGALMAAPVFEGTAPYKSSGHALDALPDVRLDPRLVAALIGKPGDDYRFDYPAYAHQVEAWGHLRANDPRSVLVSSGTGSGKTECFLVPMLDDLACEVEAIRATGGGRLAGVRALMLYPLNALIASQEKRLQRWTAPFAGDIRFALFNGLMLDKRKSDRDAEEARTPEQVRYRTTLRCDPPPILVTNTTMLEYMTIRREDQPILEASQGMLRWIVIDEAHSYVGSAAAEISLLLRRVLQAFGVEARQVRFVATSATIGRDDAQGRADLQRYLADLAGVPTTQVHVVMGERDTVEATAGSAVAAQPAMRSLVRALQTAPLDLSAIDRHMAGSGIGAADALSAIAHKPADGPPLLPLRAHNFVRAVGGLWSCLDTDCPGEKPVDWPFGTIHFAHADRCDRCSAPVFEVVSCRECGEPWLQAFDHGDRLEPRAVPGDRDDFVSAQEREGDGGDGGEASDDDDTETAPAEPLDGAPVLIATRPIAGMTAQTVDTSTGALPDKRGDHQLWLSRHANACPCLPLRRAVPVAKRDADDVGGRVSERAIRFDAAVGRAAAFVVYRQSPRHRSLRRQHRNAGRTRVRAWIRLSRRPEGGVGGGRRGSHHADGAARRAEGGWSIVVRRSDRASRSTARRARSRANGFMDPCGRRPRSRAGGQDHDQGLGPRSRRPLREQSGRPGEHADAARTRPPPAPRQLHRNAGARQAGRASDRATHRVARPRRACARGPRPSRMA